MSYYDVDQIGAIEREIYFTHIGLISKKNDQVSGSGFRDGIRFSVVARERD